MRDGEETMNSDAGIGKHDGLVCEIDDGETNAVRLSLCVHENRIIELEKRQQVMEREIRVKSDEDKGMGGGT